MKSAYWNGVEVTTINEIALHYTEGDKELMKEIKPFIRTGVSKLKSVKLTKDELLSNGNVFKNILPKNIPSTGLVFVSVSDVPLIERYFISVLKRKSEGLYKKDRFLSKRSLVDELKLELSKLKISIQSDEFSAVLSYAKRLEIGQPKVKALRDASKKFNVTQTRIKEIIESLNIQIDYKNKPKDYV